VLVPRTGRFKGFGDSVLNVVTLAIEQANQVGGLKKPMSVMVRDTAGDPMQAVKVFQDLTADDSLDAVIGPVVGNEIDSVAPLDNQKRITLLSPSISKDGMSALGPYIFSNSMTNEMQGRAIAKYAVEHLGYKRFAMLAPDDGYGETLADAFQKTVVSMGATVTNSETYTPSVTDFQKQLIALGGQNPQSSKENDLENNRRMDELKYAIGKEIGKILLKAKEAVTDSAPVSAPTPAIAFAPFIEGLTNTTCPSVVKSVNDDIQGFLKAQTDYVVRNTDLIQQAMTRLPVEFKGTTLPVNADQWTEIAPDMQASLVIAGRVVETNPPNDWSDHPTFDFIVGFDAFQLDPKKNAFVKIYQGCTKYSAFKPSNLVRTNSSYQALYLPAHSVEIPSLAAQVHFYDLNPVLLGGHLWQNETALAEGAKDMEGAYFVTGFYVDSEQGTAKKFVDDYMKRFAKRPDLLAAQAYDAARLLLQATATSSSRDDIHNQLLTIKDFDGVSGKTTFGGHGEAEKVVPILRIQGGKYQQVQ
jgi:ABC-type branched-subunit amino acid transport system substrate-binding protein